MKRTDTAVFNVKGTTYSSKLYDLQTDSIELIGRIKKEPTFVVNKNDNPAIEIDGESISFAELMKFIVKSTEEIKQKRSSSAKEAIRQKKFRSECRSWQGLQDQPGRLT